MQATQLRTNYRKDPLGIDDAAPRFSWKCRGGEKQTAYRLTVTGKDGETAYDSGRCETSAMHCRYAGTPLVSRQRLSWQVTLWDENGNETPSTPARFEMGLLQPGDWQAKWIAGPAEATDKEERLPADCFRRVFTPAGPVKAARLYATACGVYAPYVNGQRLPGVLAPGTTEYEKRLYYQTYDVTALLQPGENTLDITVGDGWFKGKIGSTNTQYFFGKRLQLLAQLVLEYADGQTETIGTDESWLWCNDGPILYTDLKDGETYDARKPPSYGGHAELGSWGVTPTASPADGIAEHETLPARLLISPSGAKLLDFGQNLAGYICFALHGQQPGQVVRLRMCEALDHGEYSDRTLLHVLPGLPSINQEIVYTCRGGEERFQPEFFYSGFRYALVEGLDTVDPADFEAVAVYSELDFTGDFHCSNHKIDKFVQNTRWSQKSNFVDVPTDCPQREKSGWTGDAQVFVGTASWLADTAAFFRKWLRDVRDCQREDGRVDNVCPKIRGKDNRDALNGAVGWADAAVIIPYTLWKRTGDDAFIRENYDLMHGWAQYVRKAAADKTYYHLPDGHMLKPMVEPFLLPDSPYNSYIIESGLHWGEWLEPDVDSGRELIRPKQEIACAYTYASMTMLAEMLEAVGKGEEAAACREFAAGAKAAYNFHFVKDGHIVNAPRQAPLVRSLALGLLDAETAQSVAADLDRSARERNYTVGTGFLSTPFVLGVLAKYGYTDTAYKMLENTVAPGWLAMVEQGATSVWENYIAFEENGSPRMQSMNHYSPGAVCSFLFETVCGLKIAGENHFAICPVPGGTLTWAAVNCDTPYGFVRSAWQHGDGNTTFTVELPANTTADITLPDGSRYAAGPGTHTYTCADRQASPKGEKA